MALPIRSFGIGSIVTVVSGTKSSPKPIPWTNCGQTMLEKPASRLRWPNQNRLPAPISRPAASNPRGSIREIRTPTSGIMSTVPIPRGAIAMPACSGE